jgi:hypothetical protein
MVWFHKQRWPGGEGKGERRKKKKEKKSHSGTPPT